MNPWLPDVRVKDGTGVLRQDALEQCRHRLVNCCSLVLGDSLQTGCLTLDDLRHIRQFISVSVEDLACRFDVSL